ncbi:MAG: membrane protein insertase YidC [Candidatus Omnitrophica bacterium]|nr:membrane protein insertase YidC [Candidatus Omnitrophota bacterium]
MDKMKEETRIFLAFLISIIIIFTFSKYQASKYRQLQPVQNERKQVSETSEIKKISSEKTIPIGEKFDFENEYYYLKFDKLGGYIDEIGLKKFLRKNEKFFPLNEKNVFFLNEEFIDNQEFKLEIKKDSVILTKEFQGVSLSKEYVIPSKDYIFLYTEKIKNKQKDRKFDKYTLNIMKIDMKNLSSQREYIPPKIILSINKLPVFLDPHRIKEEKIYKNCRWVGLNLKYSLIFVYLPEKSIVSVYPEDGYINIKLSNDDFILKEGEEKTITFKFYAGPSDYFVARNYIKEDIFGRGFFVTIGRFLFSVLNVIHNLVPNWGWAIIILTFIIKILFFPLTKKSLKSMNQLQKLRPYLQDMQKKYKDNPQQLQKELMNIYKEYNINPFAGCLPTIIQIPIFIGFFLALRNSIFLRGAHFILWIKDLSMPDTVFKIGQFPVNILPILMTISSYFQQKLTPTTDPSQKSLTVLMPLMFLFILYNFPSGLLLYWVSMNIGSLIEQILISRKKTLKKI